MVKSFAPRVAKKNRRTIDLAGKLPTDVYRISDEKLLKGAKLDEVSLMSIHVKEQVRTKFNEKSLAELAENIRVNGLIQPLVIHEERDGRFTLICGERRFRAMTLLKMESVPCFVLKNKSSEELMAIQFSENSSREDLHYIDKADGIYNYQQATRASERKIVAAMGISKSDVHRSLLIAKMPSGIKEAAKVHNIEKYVLVEFEALEKGVLKNRVRKLILSGDVTKRAQLRRVIKDGGVLSTGTKSAKRRGPKPRRQMDEVASLVVAKSVATGTKRGRKATTQRATLGDDLLLDIFS
ncbi:MAG: ParB/RepB/Spo0J family partition protein [Bdellovibrionales bacterium]|nr:ParB/RepB/Spo0J family partition protein [Bdellovibrionales bacterium]